MIPEARRLPAPAAAEERKLRREKAWSFIMVKLLKDIFVFFQM
jgi:hypothetical protein